MRPANVAKLPELLSPQDRRMIGSSQQDRRRRRPAQLAEDEGVSAWPARLAISISSSTFSPLRVECRTPLLGAVNGMVILALHTRSRQ